MPWSQHQYELMVLQTGVERLAGPCSERVVDCKLCGPVSWQTRYSMDSYHKGSKSISCAENKLIEQYVVFTDDRHATCVLQGFQIIRNAKFLCFTGIVITIYFNRSDPCAICFKLFLQEIKENTHNLLGVPVQYLSHFIKENWNKLFVVVVVVCCCCLMFPGTAVLVHGDEGTDGTLQVTSLVQVLLDSNCRTIKG